MAAKTARQTRKSKNERMAWWREARFGMFIHWGIYAVPAGVWKGNRIAGIGEWIMNRAKIPVGEYEKLARKFNPVKFNADEWVRAAKNAGMKYIVITSKHHDGFAMYHSKCSKYNIVDATPFKRDPIKELARACKKAGVRLCFYYSQKQDWHEPDASGNRWDWPDDSKKNFDRYMDEKGLPQVREILTQYGPIGLIWYDTPQDIKPAQTRRFVKQVYKYQPNCLVDGRAGHNIGDYRSMGDNQIPPAVVKGDWETPATLNDTWGFKSYDHNWKSVGDLLRLLIGIVSKGGNYLLNVGPTAKGVIPAPSVQRLAAVGKWLKVNGEAIYGSKASPYPYELGWAAITTKPSKLYLHVLDWPGKEIVLYGLKNKVTKAYLLADRKKALSVTQEYDKAINLHTLRLRVPAKAPDKIASVIALEIKGAASMDQALLQQPNGAVILGSYNGQIREPAKGLKPRDRLVRGRFGAVENWTNTKASLSWEFKLAKPGAYNVVVLSSTDREGQWLAGHRVKVTVGRQAVKGALKDQGRTWNPKAPTSYSDVATKIGRVSLAKAGIHTVTFKPEKLVRGKAGELKLSSIRLVPAQ